MNSRSGQVTRCSWCSRSSTTFGASCPVTATPPAPQHTSSCCPHKHLSSSQLPSGAAAQSTSRALVTSLICSAYSNSLHDAPSSRRPNITTSFWPHQVAQRSPASSVAACVGLSRPCSRAWSAHSPPPPAFLGEPSPAPATTLSASAVPAVPVPASWLSVPATPAPCAGASPPASASTALSSMRHSHQHPRQQPRASHRRVSMTAHAVASPQHSTHSTWTANPGNTARPTNTANTSSTTSNNHNTTPTTNPNGHSTKSAIQLQQRQTRTRQPTPPSLSPRPSSPSRPSSAPATSSSPLNEFSAATASSYFQGFCPEGQPGCSPVWEQLRWCISWQQMRSMYDNMVRAETVPAAAATGAAAEGNGQCGVSGGSSSSGGGSADVTSAHARAAVPPLTGGLLGRDEIYSFLLQLQDFDNSRLQEGERGELQAFRCRLVRDLSYHVRRLDAEQLEALCCASAVSGGTCLSREHADAVQERLLVILTSSSAAAVSIPPTAANHYHHLSTPIHTRHPLNGTPSPTITTTTSVAAAAAVLTVFDEVAAMDDSSSSQQQHAHPPRPRCASDSAGTQDLTPALNVIFALYDMGHLPQVALLQAVFRVAVDHLRHVTRSQWHGLHGLARRFRFLLDECWLEDLHSALTDPRDGACHGGTDFGCLAPLLGCIAAFTTNGVMEALDTRVMVVVEVIERRYDEGRSLLSSPQLLVLAAQLAHMRSPFAPKWLAGCRGHLAACRSHTGGLPGPALMLAVELLLRGSGWGEKRLLRQLLRQLFASYLHSPAQHPSKQPQHPVAARLLPSSTPTPPPSPSSQLTPPPPPPSLAALAAAVAWQIDVCGSSSSTASFPSPSRLISPSSRPPGDLAALLDWLVTKLPSGPGFEFSETLDFLRPLVSELIESPAARAQLFGGDGGGCGDSLEPRRVPGLIRAVSLLGCSPSREWVSEAFGLMARGAEGLSGGELVAMLRVSQAQRLPLPHATLQAVCSQHARVLPLMRAVDLQRLLHCWVADRYIPSVEQLEGYLDALSGVLRLDSSALKAAAGDQRYSTARTAAAAAAAVAGTSAVSPSSPPAPTAPATANGAVAPAAKVATSSPSTPISPATTRPCMMLSSFDDEEDSCSPLPLQLHLGSASSPARPPFASSSVATAAVDASLYDIRNLARNAPVLLNDGDSGPGGGGRGSVTGRSSGDMPAGAAAGIPRVLLQAAPLAPPAPGATAAAAVSAGAPASASWNPSSTSAVSAAPGATAPAATTAAAAAASPSARVSHQHPHGSLDGRVRPPGASLQPEEAEAMRGLLEEYRSLLLAAKRSDLLLLVNTYWAAVIRALRSIAAAAAASAPAAATGAGKGRGGAVVGQGACGAARSRVIEEGRAAETRLAGGVTERMGGGGGEEPGATRAQQQEQLQPQPQLSPCFRTRAHTKPSPDPRPGSGPHSQAQCHMWIAVKSQTQTQTQSQSQAQRQAPAPIGAARLLRALRQG